MYLSNHRNCWYLYRNRTLKIFYSILSCSVGFDSFLLVVRINFYLCLDKNVWNVHYPVLKHNQFISQTPFPHQREWIKYLWIITWSFKVVKGVQSSARWTENSTRHGSCSALGELVEGTEFKSFKYISNQEKLKVFKNHWPHFWKIIHSCDCISRWKITPPLLSPFPQALASWAQFCKCCLVGQFLPFLLSHAPELVPITAPSDGLWNEGKKPQGRPGHL